MRSIGAGVVAAWLWVGCAKSTSPAPSVEGRTKRVEAAAVSAADGAIPPDIYGAMCKGGPKPFGDVVMPIAERLQRKKIWYDGQNPDDMSDCSGIFHRVLESYDKKCPGQPLPGAEAQRSSRQIGRWYLDAGLLTLIRDPIEQQHLIQAGSVLFFADDGVAYHRMPPEEAMEEIHHLGVVVETTRTEDGELVSYRMFHGRRTGTYASITNWHRATSKPPFGNGKDKVIAVAPIAKPLGRTILEQLGVPPLPGELLLSCAEGDTRTASEVVAPAAEELRGKRVRVRWQNERDKVRVFTLLLQEVAAACPNVVVPPDEAVQSHVRLAQWYVAEGEFETVDDARTRGDWIVPGSVMFFGPASVDYADMDPEDLLTHIDHMGVVVSVTRDGSDHVVGYTLFQAPPEGAFEAQFTEGNALGAALPFGLEGRAWLGVAPISAR